MTPQNQAVIDHVVRMAPKPGYHLGPTVRSAARDLDVDLSDSDGELICEILLDRLGECWI